MIHEIEAVDLVLFRGRGYSELLARPQADLRAGLPIDTTPPDHRDLDQALAKGIGAR